jgi:hypothetical protein
MEKKMQKKEINATEKTARISAQDRTLKEGRMGQIEQIARDLFKVEIKKRQDKSEYNVYTWNNAVNEKIATLSDTEKAKLLLAAREVYPDYHTCGGSLKEDKIGFKDPSDCGSCVNGQILFKGIFDEAYMHLPFVTFDGDRHRTVDFKLAKLYAEKGEKGVKDHFGAIEREKKEEEKKRWDSLSDKSKFRELAEKERSDLRKRGQYGSSSDLYIAENARVAVIGIQTSESGSGWDTIYVVKGKGDKVDVKTAIDRTFSSGRMFPTGISKDGKKFFYTIKDESGTYHKCEQEIK